MTDEFLIIKKYFTRSSSDGTVGIGDDAAVISVASDEQLLTCVDTMVSGVHFLANDDPFLIGYKLMAVNLSDIAAMGGVPKWATLAITLPKIDENWLKLFSFGLFSLADEYGIQLVGGDTTKGDSLVLSLQMMGVVPKNQAVLRSGAKPTDLIFVTNSLGGAAFDLFNKLNCPPIKLSKNQYLHRPKPQIANGLKLRHFATAMIDISDGLLQDLSHILKASGVGAILDVDKIPFADEIKNDPKRYEYVFCGGEDYQLLFTIDKNDLTKMSACDMIVTQIGEVVCGKNLKVINYNNSLNCKGFNHF